MQFDVIIGNPPYQLDDGGYGTSAAPIYQLFVEQAKKLDPRYLSHGHSFALVRWRARGWTSSASRCSPTIACASIDRLSQRIATCFPGVGLKGGVCYFLWDRDNPRAMPSHHAFQGLACLDSQSSAILKRAYDVFIRFNEGLSILKKVVAVESGRSHSLSLPDSKRFDRLVSSSKPFGLETTFKGKAAKAPVTCWSIRTAAWATSPRRSITTGTDLIDKWKVLCRLRRSRAPATETPTHTGSSARHSSESPAPSRTETYLCIGPFDSKSRGRKRRCPTSRVGLTRFLDSPAQAIPGHNAQGLHLRARPRSGPSSGRTRTSTRSTGSPQDEIAFIEKVADGSRSSMDRRRR